jgi:hypothetical protein
MNRRCAWLTLAVLSGSSAVLLFSGCGDDTTTPAQTPDTGVGDGTTPDATTEAGPDAGADQTTADAPADRTVETGNDAGDASDSTTAADADAGADAAACVLFDASGLDEASVQAGKLALWTVYKCQGCHQNASLVVDDAGNGLVLAGNDAGIGDSGMIFPPNLTDDPTTGLGCWTDTQVVNAILTGVDNEGKMLCPSMPRWGSPLPTADGGTRAGTPMDAGTAQQIVDFLRSLPSVNNQVTQTTCPMPPQDGGGDAAEGGDASDASDAARDAGVDAGDAASE